MKRTTVIVFLLIAIGSFGQAPSRIGDRITDNSCRFTFDDDPIPDCVVTVGGQVRIVPLFVRRLDFTRDSLSPVAARYGLAVVMVGYSFDYADRSGRIRIENVAELDNGPSDFKYGVVRVYSGAKMNFATATGKLLFPIDYEWVTGFAKGRAYGCIGCRKICDLPVTDWRNCEDIDISYVGGNWFRLTATGESTPIPPERWSAWMRDPGIADRPTYHRPDRPNRPKIW